MPVLAAIMTASAHRRGGRAAIQGLLRGIVVGMWGGVAFFAVVGALVGQAPHPATYVAAALSACVVGWAATRIATFQPALRLQQYLHDAPLGGALHRFDRAFERVALGNQRRRIDVPAFKKA
jgi:hypothetical protein